MLQEQENTWTGGMNLDLSKTKIPSNIYYNSYNLRLTTDKGLSTGSMENIRGTLDLLTIPNLPIVQKLVIDTSITGPVTFTISNGVFSDVGTGSFTITSGSTPQDLWNYFQSDAGYVNLNTQYFIYYNENYLVFTPAVTNTNLFTIAPTSAGVIVDSSFVPAQTDVEIIGNVFINDNIYLLTTNNTTLSPGEDDPDSYGQIWKLVVDPVTLTGTLTLLYNNKTNWSTYWAFAPTAVQGRFENGDIQRIYFTDFFNPLRSFNTVNPQGFALDPTLLNIVPAVDFDIPRLINIYSGTGAIGIPVGCYQTAYRLKNTTGSTTQFSPLSNMVFNVGANDSAATGGNNWRTYIGGAKGTTIDKRMVWEISAIDTDYERIEFAVLVRETKDEIPTIYLIEEYPLNGQDVFTFTFDGDVLNDVTTQNLSLEEFLQISGVFTHCKTITSKDNRLIPGNVKTKKALLDFDVRAYRFKSPNAFDLKDNGAITNYFLPGGYDLVDEESDAIALYNLDSTDPDFSPTHIYKADGVTVGGEGPNLSYEFLSIAVQGDKGIDITSCTPAPYVSTDTNYNISSINLGVYSVQQDGTDVLQIYPTTIPDGINEGIKFAQYNAVLIGYQHNEIYREGIQFFDKAKNPYFVSWIADIKFPDYADVCPLANSIFVDGTQTGQTVYSKSFQSSVPTGTNATYVNQLGLKISLTIPAEISEKISGFSFVRVKREEKDKTIIAEGIISDFAVNPSGNDYYAGGTWYGTSLTSLKRAFFLTPNLLDMSLAQPAANMFLRTKFLLNQVNATSAICPDTDCSCTDLYEIYKVLESDFTGYVPEEKNIEFMRYMDSANQYIVDGDDVFNYLQGTQGIGNHVYYFKLDSDLVDPTGSPANRTKIFAVVVREGITQYGGNTFAARANNEYIRCSHFQPVKTSLNDQSYNFYLYGGDVTNSINDDQRLSKNWSQAGTLQSVTYYYPASSPVNSGLRHGAHTNYSLLGDTPSNSRDTYEYNTVYSCEDDIVKFFPKPDPFIEEDVFVNRFYVSEIKINGELLDSWAIYKPLNYWDVDGNNGPINGAINLKDEILFIQDKAFGRLLVNPKVAITSAEGEELQVGRGNVLDSHDYISNEKGSKHQFSFLKSDTSVYFTESRHKELCQYSINRPLEPFSDIKGFHSWMINNFIGEIQVTDKPVYMSPTKGLNGVHGVFDYINSELIYTFERSSNPQNISKNTIVFKEDIGVFQAFYNHEPKQYVTNNKFIISANPSDLQHLYLHNEGEYGKFYGTYYPSFIEFFSNKWPQFTKNFTNLVFQTEVQNGSTLVDTASGATPIQETFNLLEVSNDYQSNSVVLSYPTNLKRRFRTWYCEIPRSNTQAANMSTGFFSRLKDKYLKIKLSFLNNGNKRLIIHSVFSRFLMNSPK